MAKKNQKRFYMAPTFLFSKYHQGIRIAENMWYSVTPEEVADTVARRLKLVYGAVDNVIDAAGGAGGNTIAFARFGYNTIYIDPNRDVLFDAVHNAHIYKCLDIDYYGEKVEDLDLSMLVSDPERTVFYSSPEWGGPSYKSQEIFDVETCTPPASVLVQHARKYNITRVCLYLPRNSDLNQLALLGAQRIEYLYVSSRLIALLAYWLPPSAP